MMGFAKWHSAARIHAAFGLICIARRVNNLFLILLVSSSVSCGKDLPTQPTATIESLFGSAPLPWPSEAGTPPNYSGVWVGEGGPQRCVAVYQSMCSRGLPPIRTTTTLTLNQAGITLNGMFGSAFQGYVSADAGIVGANQMGSRVRLVPSRVGFDGIAVVDTFDGTRLIKSELFEVTDLRRTP